MKEITIRDEIDGKTVKEVEQQLNSFNGEDVVIYINSEGGEIQSGLAIAKMLERYGGKVRCEVEGFCCSIATQIFFAGDEKIMPKNGYLMIHTPMIEMEGDAAELRKAADSLDVIQTGLETTYQKHALEGVTAEQIHEMVEKETWLTGEKAAKIFDITVKGEIQIKNSSKRFNRFKHLPPVIKDNITKYVNILNVKSKAVAICR